jgi:hypothetical protein
LFGERDLELAPLSFNPLLNTVNPVLNLIDYLRSKVRLGKLLEMFGPGLQVIYQVICRHVGRVGTGVFLNQMLQIN